MAQAILADRPHRCSLEFSLHVVDVMTTILRAAEEASVIDIATSCERPQALGPEAAQALFA